MTIGSGNLILAADYNAVQTIVANVLGTGASGYGQTVASSQVTAGNNITASQMQNLKTDLDKISFKQTNAASTAPSVSVGGQMTASDWASYSSQATTLQTNRYILNVNQATTVDGVTPTFANWNGTRTHNVTVTFADAANARYFFNTGGEIRIVPSHSSSGSSTPNLAKGNAWVNFLSTIGTIKFGYTNTTAGVTGSSIGWYGLTSSAQTILTSTSTLTYANNIFSVQASCNVANNSTGTATVLTLVINFNDAGNFTSGSNTIDEAVGGTTTSRIQHYRATGANVSVNAPTIATVSGP
jgi:hypothetical protein